MVILIDGHNLIPHIPGLSLAQFDDEQKLVEMLQVFARVRRKKVEVIFDKAPMGQALKRTYGTIRVQSARPGLNADEEIRLRLEALGASARQYTVVSSDLRVQTYARAARAKIEGSDSFAQQVMGALAQATKQNDQAGERTLDAQEIAMWMEIFNSKSREDKP